MGGKNYRKDGSKKNPKKESTEGNKPNPNDLKKMSDDGHNQSKPNPPSKVEVQPHKEQGAWPKLGQSASIKSTTPDVPKQYSGKQPSKTSQSQNPQQTRNTFSEKESALSMPGPSSGCRPDASSEMVHRFSQQSLEPKVESDSKGMRSEISIQPKVITTMKAVSSKVSGTRGRSLGQIETNYVEILTDNMVYDLVYQHDVKITAVEDPSKKKNEKKRADQNREAPKKYRKQIFERFQRRNFPDVYIAYDGSNIAYSPKKLDLSLPIIRNVEYTDPETGNTRQYLVDISETEDAEIPLKTLKEYAKTKEEVSPRALQALHTILKCAFQRVPNGILSGRSFYIPSEPRMDLGDHFDLWFGLFQSVVLGNRPLLNVDISHKGFPKPFRSLVQLWEIIENGENEINRRNPRYRERDPADVMAQHLNGLNIIYNQPGDPCTKKMYKFMRLVDEPSKQTFQDDNGSRRTVAAYFRQQYPNFPITRPKLPCIQLDATGRIMVPMEFCGISDRQLIYKKYTELQTKKMIEISATSTDERKKRILEKMEEVKHSDADILKLIIGADVTHPSPDQRTIPSVVGVIASHESNDFSYNPSGRLQRTVDGQSEVVEINQDFKNTMKEHLKIYQKENNNNLPDKIFYYRDGVSESQYQHVETTERMAMIQACAELKHGYEKHVQITIIIVQKQMFHIKQYSVISDGGNHDIGDIQELTYDLCHLFARCNRAVSYPAPTYYAHLMAFRGRKYVEGKRNLDFNNLEQEWRNRAIKREIVEGHPMFIV